MAQPIKKGTPNTKKPAAKKRRVKDERLPRVPRSTPLPRSKRPHPEYGTSKLEKRFAKDFLDKLGIKYIYQFKAEEIGRYFDFYLPENNVIIEVDGDYWHGKGLVHEEKNRMQKHAEWVDKQKDIWAIEHGIPVIRIWENDINNNPQKVVEILRKKLAEYRKAYEKQLKKKQRH